MAFTTLVDLESELFGFVNNYTIFPNFKDVEEAHLDALEYKNEVRKK